jgi:Arc/MetJ-type ribon-helix-helix transcriptional regulator
VINKATESIGKAIESALSARDHVVMVRVNDESLKRLDALVQSGIFKSRSEAAAFLISEGIQAQRALFERIAEKISEIERLRSELKSIVNTEES